MSAGSSPRCAARVVLDQVADHVVRSCAAPTSWTRRRGAPRIAARLHGKLARTGATSTSSSSVDQAGAQAVVDVVVVVGDLVGEVRDLRLEARLPALEETLAQLAELARVVERAVLEDALARLKGEIQPGETRRSAPRARRPRAATAGCARSRRIRACIRSARPGRRGRTACGRGRAPGRSPRPASR